MEVLWIFSMYKSIKEYVKANYPVDKISTESLPENQINVEKFLLRLNFTLPPNQKNMKTFDLIIKKLEVSKILRAEYDLKI